MTVHKATIVEGRVVPHNPILWGQDLHKYQGKKIRLEIKADNGTRTLTQNRLYWVYIHAIAADTGDTPDAIHEAFKLKFLRRFTSEGFEYAGSTTGLDTAEFTKYIDTIKAFARDELGIILPEPNDENMLAYLASTYGI